MQFLLDIGEAEMHRMTRNEATGLHFSDHGCAPFNVEVGAECVLDIQVHVKQADQY